ncbi:MAG: hypothetical protein QXN71_01925 [Candidatus Aenigmatarchaeota archaeon]
MLPTSPTDSLIIICIYKQKTFQNTSEYGITGANSWNNIKFRTNSNSGTLNTLISTQTLNSVAVYYINERINNITLVYNGNHCYQ